MERIVTIEDVAAAAGVGRGTVDRVIHGRGRVSQATRERVEKCIRELGYRPNIAARMLAKTRAYRIAVCFHDKEREFWTQVKQGILRAAREYEPMGVHLDMFLLPEIDVKRQLEVIRKAIEDDYDGIALVPYSSAEICEALNEAVEKGICVMTFNNHEAGINACYVGMNGIQSGRTAGRMMSMSAPHGSRYMIISPHSLEMTQLDEREAGFREIIDRERSDMEFYGRFVIEGYDSIFELALEKLKENNVDAVYATNECVSAVGRAVDAAGLTGKVTVVGHDVTETVLHYIRKRCISASIGQDPVYQGYAAIDKICKRLLTGEQTRDEYTKISIVVAENSDYS